MYTAHLFLGVKVSGTLKEDLAKADKQLLKIFINNSNDQYLCELEHQGCLYVGKFTEPTTKLAKLKLLEVNILSLLERITSNISPNNNKVLILPHIEH